MYKSTKVPSGLNITVDITIMWLQWSWNKSTTKMLTSDIVVQSVEYELFIILQSPWSYPPQSDSHNENIDIVKISLLHWWDQTGMKWVFIIIAAAPSAQLPVLWSVNIILCSAVGRCATMSNKCSFRVQLFNAFSLCAGEGLIQLLLICLHCPAAVHNICSMIYLHSAVCTLFSMNSLNCPLTHYCVLMLCHRAAHLYCPLLDDLCYCKTKNPQPFLQ